MVIALLPRPFFNILLWPQFSVDTPRQLDTTILPCLLRVCFARFGRNELLATAATKVPSGAVAVTTGPFTDPANPLQFHGATQVREDERALVTKGLF